MAAPVFQAAGTFQSGAGVALTVPWPVHEPGDIAILVLSNGTAAAVGLATANGFVAIPGSPQTATGLGGEAFWCRATSTSMASPITNTAGNNISGVIVTVRGCVPTGDPWNVTSASSKTTTSTATSITGGTTTLADTLIVYAVARASDQAANQYSGEADATLTGVAERADNGTVSGNGGGIGIWTGTKATAGAYGPLSATLANTSTELYWSMALRPTAPTFRSEASTAGAGSPAVVTKPTGTVDGDVLVAVVACYADTTPTITPPAGWTLDKTQAATLAGTTYRVSTYTKLAASEGASYSFSWNGTNNNGRAAILTYRDVGSATPDISAIVADTTADTSYLVPTATTTVANCLVIFGSVVEQTTTATVDAATASRLNSSDAVASFVIADQQIAVAGATGTRTHTGTSRTDIAFTIALVPPASGVTGTVTVTQADQTSAASATETLTATSAQTQAAQTSTASGSVANPVTGTVAQTQADQTSTATAAETFTGTSANVQADQTSTAAGAVGAAPITGTVSVTQDDQTSTASGFSVQNLSGTVAVTQADQTSTATAVETFTGTSANVQDDQTSTATATFGFTGTVAVTQDNQTSTASAIAAVTVTGTVAVTQQDQFSTATANGGTVTFWVPYPVGYVFNPVAYVSNPAGFVRVGPDSIPPAW